MIPTYLLISKFFVCLLFKENYSNYIMYRSPKVEINLAGMVEYALLCMHLAIHVFEVTVTIAAWLVDGTHF